MPGAMILTLGALIGVHHTPDPNTELEEDEKDTGENGQDQTKDVKSKYKETFFDIAVYDGPETGIKNDRMTLSAGFRRLVICGIWDCDPTDPCSCGSWA